MAVKILTGTPGIGSLNRINLEINTKKYYLDNVTKDEIKKLEELEPVPEQTKIREAYYGRAQFEPYKSGLNLIIDYKDKFVDGISFARLSVIFTKKKDIEGIMNELNVDRVENLAYKKILAYRIESEDLGKKLIAILAYPK
ncbi:hypothetical protein COY26_04975 [Candidatus Woesearchaeota archaeon CG_4_10_14_0_2_um_filter_33_10]|nr:MAG: hypothetical protein AUJ83_03645 [Candidatus Woesearchaeota archaeon CG1_02_33_12]PIZ52258.1 MAG: hypothetical protein COY26_04975 [Candidatus Woesearchaeota archaeon CG_4_10_14_0_2_um_filter_33_10]